VVVVGDQEPGAGRVHGNTRRHRADGYDFAVMQRWNAQTSPMTQREGFHGMYPLSVGLFKDMHVVIAAAGHEESLAIRRPCQSRIAIQNLQYLALRGNGLTNIVDKHIFGGLIEKDASLRIEVAIEATGENEQCTAVR